MSFLVIGTGAIGQRHINNLKYLNEKFTAISMRNDGIEAVSAAMKNHTFEGAILCTKTQERHNIIALLAPATLPVYIEKPIAYRHNVLDNIIDTLGTLTQRCFVGFMMRYHPAVRYLTTLDSKDFYSFSLHIGHDVRQWRKNWHFKNSYASNPDGGGVLLDLCHELDMITLLLDKLQINQVRSLEHPHYPQVDFSSLIILNNHYAQGTITMDYITPHPTRQLQLWGYHNYINFDFINNRYLHDKNGVITYLDLAIERQAMFQAALSDFIQIIRGQKSNNPCAPILSRIINQCRLICHAYNKRNFIGQTKGILL